MVTSVPTFLSSTLHSGPGAFGAIEGVSDALTDLSKLAGGPLASEPDRRAKLASSGYRDGNRGRRMRPHHPRVAGRDPAHRAWVSGGIRSPARDRLLSDFASHNTDVPAVGVERAGDNVGDLVGPLAASGLVVGLGVRHTIMLAAIPGVLAAAAITVAAGEARRAFNDTCALRTQTLNALELGHAGLPQTLMPVALFKLGNLATTLLILRATDLVPADGTGRSLTPTAATSLAIRLYAAHDPAATAGPLGGAHPADRVEPRAVFAVGGVMYVAACTQFAAGITAWPALMPAFLLAGIGIGFGETAESTAHARGLPEQLRNNGFGVLGLIQAIGDLKATVVTGVLWATVSPLAAFSYAGAWMAASVICADLLHTRHRDSDRDGDERGAA